MTSNCAGRGLLIRFYRVYFKILPPVSGLIINHNFAISVFDPVFTNNDTPLASRMTSHQNTKIFFKMS